MKKIYIFFASLLAVSALTAQPCTLTLRPNGSQGIDAEILSNFPNTNFGNNAELVAAAWTSGGPLIIRSFLYFDLSVLPVNAKIHSATVNLYNDPFSAQGLGNGEHSSLSGSNAAWLQRVNSPWTETGITWNNQPGSDTLHQATLPQSTNVHQDYALDVTLMVRDMVANPSQNYGFELMLQDENYYRALVFASSDHADPTNRPSLVISYSPDTTVTVYPDSLVAPAGNSYQWLDCDSGNSVIPGATGQSMVATGNFAVVVTANGCSDTSDCHLLQLTAIQETALPGHFSFFPNPAKDVIRVVNQKQDQHCMEKLEVRNVLGALLQQEMHPACKDATLDIASLAPGIYFLTVVQGEDQFTFRFTKE